MCRLGRSDDSGGAGVGDDWGPKYMENALGDANEKKPYECAMKRRVHSHTTHSIHANYCGLLHGFVCQAHTATEWTEGWKPNLSAFFTEEPVWCHFNLNGSSAHATSNIDTFCIYLLWRLIRITAENSNNNNKKEPTHNVNEILIWNKWYSYCIVRIRRNTFLCCRNARSLWRRSKCRQNVPRNGETASSTANFMCVCFPFQHSKRMEKRTFLCVASESFWCDSRYQVWLCHVA